VLHLDAANVKSYPGAGTVWKDLSGNGNNGTLVNGVGFDSANNGSMVFDGIDDFASTQSILFSNEITLCSFFKFINLQTGERSLFRKEGIFQLGFSNPSAGTIRNLIRTSGTSGWTGANDFNFPFVLGNWYYFCFSYKSGDSNFYVNHDNIKNLTTITGNIVDNTYPIGIGARGTNSQLAINANISVSQIYNRALTDAEVRQNFESLRGRYGI
jgi:hypothetical protein